MSIPCGLRAFLQLVLRQRLLCLAAVACTGSDFCAMSLFRSLVVLAR